MAPSKTLYDVLGIDAAADDAEIKRAWKVLVQVWHPDRFSGEMRDHAETQVQHINEAYGTLRDAGKRAAYDRKLAYGAGVSESTSAQTERGAFGSSAPRRTATPGVARPHTGSQLGGSSAVAMHAAKPFSEAANDLLSSMVDALRRNPRVAVAVVSVWVLLVGGSVINSLLSGPHVPADLAQREAISLHEQRVSAADQGPDPLAALDAAAKNDAVAPAPSLPPVNEAAPTTVAPSLPAVEAPADQAPALSPGHHRVLRILPQNAR